MKSSMYCLLETSDLQNLFQEVLITQSKSAFASVMKMLANQRLFFGIKSASRCFDAKVPAHR